MSRGVQDALLCALGGILAAAAAATGIGWAAARLACGTARPSSLFAGVQAAAGDPASYAVPPGCQVPVGLIRGADAAAAVILVCLGIAAALWWRRHSQSEGHFIRELRARRGFAEAAEVRRHLGPKATARKTAILRPSRTGRARPEDAGWRVGSARGIDAYVSIEDSVIVLGPPRSGKGWRFVINAILDWAGPLATTSTRNDNLAATLAERSRRGRVTVFDPQRLSGVESDLKVSPVTGCEDPLTAEQRAAAIIGASALGQSRSNQEWAGASTSVLARLLHAAALAGRGVQDLSLWGESPSAAAEAADILAVDGPPGWGPGLSSIVHGDEKMLGSIWFGVQGALAPLRIPQIAEAMDPAPGRGFDAAEFLAGEDTLYLIGTGRGAGAAGAFLAALMDDVVEQARRKALASPGNRLDPPLGLVLDEIANMFAWPALPTVMADGGGIGISPLVVLQARTQAETAWSHPEMVSVFSSATAKLMLGGSADTGFLKDMEAILGTREVQRRSRSYSEDTASSQYSKELRPLMAADEMKRLPASLGLLSYRTMRPVLLDLHAWGDRADAARIRAGKKATEASQQAVFAAQAEERRRRYPKARR